MTRAWSLLAVLAIAALLGWLRDPPWLADMTSGLDHWIVDESGARARLTGGRASFFVPADARVVRFPVRAIFDSPADWPMTVSIALDGRRIEQLQLDQPHWRTVEIRLPPRGSRRHRRIDIHLNRLRTGDRGVYLGEVELTR